MPDKRWQDEQTIRYGDWEYQLTDEQSDEPHVFFGDDTIETEGKIWRKTKKFRNFFGTMSVRSKLIRRGVIKGNLYE